MHVTIKIRVGKFPDRKTSTAGNFPIHNFLKLIIFRNFNLGPLYWPFSKLSQEMRGKTLVLTSNITHNLKKTQIARCNLCF